LPAWNDYAVTISAPYYRPFTSYNAGIAPPARPANGTTTITADDIYSANTTQTFDFDAYLFPESLPTPPLTVSIIKTDASTTPAEGSIRLRPTSLSSIQDQASGVAGQVWANDQDMLAAVVSMDFGNGSANIDPGLLVYGVTYAVTVYGVAGYQPATATMRAGSQESLIVNISTTASPLLITANTISQCKPYGQSTNVVATAQITFTFNTSMVDDVTTTSGKGNEILDNGLSVATMMFASLKPSASAFVQERGTSFLLNGNTLSIAWNPSAGLVAPSPSDSITTVTYGGLSSIMLQPSGHPELAKSLASMLPGGMTSIVCAN